MDFTKTILEKYSSPHFHQHVYQAAYAARLHKGFSKIGLDILPKAGDGFGINKTIYDLKLANHVAVMQEYRDRRFEAYLDEYWLYKVGKVVFEGPLPEEDSEDDENDEDDENGENDDMDSDSDRNHSTLHNDDDDYGLCDDDERLSEDFSVKDWKPLRKREQPRCKKALKKLKKGKWKW